MDQERFITYTTDDFILDEDFREIVRESASTDRLKELLENHFHNIIHLLAKRVGEFIEIRNKKISPTRIHM